MAKGVAWVLMPAVAIALGSCGHAADMAAGWKAETVEYKGADLQCLTSGEGHATSVASCDFEGFYDANPGKVSMTPSLFDVRGVWSLDFVRSGGSTFPCLSRTLGHATTLATCDFISSKK